MTTYAYGLPRLGKKREYKTTIESFWRKECSEEDVWTQLKTIQENNRRTYQNKVSVFPDAEVSAYDPLFDTAIAYGLYNPQSLDEYYELCRGKNALEMTKWFNTNYHYLVPNFLDLPQNPFKANLKNPIVSRLKSGKFPQFIGPFTLLKLAKGIDKDQFSTVFNALIPVVKEILDTFESVQLEEPAFVMDLSDEEIALIKSGYETLGQSQCNIHLITYYDDVDFLDSLVQLPVYAIGLDLVSGSQNARYVCEHGFPDDKVLIAGLVDGRNVWKADQNQSQAMRRQIQNRVKTVWVSNAGPLSHLPHTVSIESKLHPVLQQNLSFAYEKLDEIVEIGSGNAGSNDGAPLDKIRTQSSVQSRVASLQASDFVKPESHDSRKGRHQSQLNLPLFPTTTIGSFPQTKEVRQKRAAYRRGDLSEADYQSFINTQIDSLVAFQEDLGLDVLVHGEFERTDMVEFFAQQLDGIATTQNGWVISYGTRGYRPPIIYGDVSRPEPMTLREIKYAQQQTDKPMKGMLTGPVTIIAWSFCRNDIPMGDVANQIGLALQDEIRDYETAGIKIVQVDEAAFRELAPIKKKAWSSYFDWAVKSFNLTVNTSPDTQIHTHMCYSEFGEIIGYINEMDFDVISIEASRSKGDILNYFSTVQFSKQIGLGVWDIHSPAVPDVSKQLDIVKQSLTHISDEQFWLNPDCGLKTRDWPETKASLQNLVTAAKQLRESKVAIKSAVR
jgi:5-methyltetrahydropteroyltriglutamate--homocysteine methyltransferase